MCACVVSRTGVAAAATAAAVGNELFSLGLEQLEICCFKQIWLEIKSGVTEGEGGCG